MLCFKYGGVRRGKLHELLMKELDEVLKMELQLKIGEWLEFKA